MEVGQYVMVHRCLGKQNKPKWQKGRVVKIYNGSPYVSFALTVP